MQNWQWNEQVRIQGEHERGKFTVGSFGGQKHILVNTFLVKFTSARSSHVGRKECQRHTYTETHPSLRPCMSFFFAAEAIWKFLKSSNWAKQPSNQCLLTFGLQSQFLSLYLYGTQRHRNPSRLSYRDHTRKLDSLGVRCTGLTGQCKWHQLKEEAQIPQLRYHVPWYFVSPDK